MSMAGERENDARTTKHTLHTDRSAPWRLHRSGSVLSDRRGRTITHIDQQIKRIIRQIDDWGNTVVIMTSDHGDRVTTTSGEKDTPTRAPPGSRYC